MQSRNRVFVVAAVALGLLLAAFLSNRLSIDRETPAFQGAFPVSGVDATEEHYIYVDIKGEVVRPGVYKVAAGTRLFQLIDRAGGLRENADADVINQAALLHDQTMVYIPSLCGSLEPDETRTGPISLSHAPLERLVSLPNIGESTAQRIIDYREQHGPFRHVEDIMAVSGIGEATYEAIKPLVVP